MTPKGMNTWKSNSLSHMNVPAWRGVLCRWRAIESSTCHLLQSVSILGACVHDLYTQSFRNITDWLTSHEWVLVFLLLSLTFVGSRQGFGVGTCDSCCHLRLRYVSQRLCCQCCCVEVMQRRRDSVDGLICCRSVLHPVCSVAFLAVSSCLSSSSHL